MRLICRRYAKSKTVALVFNPAYEYQHVAIYGMALSAARLNITIIVSCLACVKTDVETHETSQNVD